MTALWRTMCTFGLPEQSSPTMAPRYRTSRNKRSHYPSIREATVLESHSDHACACLYHSG